MRKRYVYLVCKYYYDTDSTQAVFSTRKKAVKWLKEWSGITSDGESEYYEFYGISSLGEAWYIEKKEVL